MATHYVGLRYGSTTISLVGSGVLLEGYSPRAANVGPGGMYEDVSERIDILVEGANIAAAQDKWQAIGRLLARTVERRALGEGEKLYLEVEPADDGVRYRTEIRKATLTPYPEIFTEWANAKFSGSIMFTREPFFWGARTQVSLTNRWGTDNTSGLRIDNKETGSFDAHVDITAAKIDGELPTPAEIWLQNDDGSGRGYQNFYIGVNAHSDPLNIIPVLEAEAAGGAAQGDFVDANASGGNRTAWTINGANTTIRATWTIPAAWAEAFRGRYVRVLMKLGLIQSNWVIQPKIMERYAAQTIFTGLPVVVRTGSKIVDLGAIPLPPVAYTSGLADQVFALDMYHDGSLLANSYLEADFIFFMPTDSGRTIVQRGMQIPATDYMIFDEIEGVWVSYEDSLKHPIYSPRGPGVMLFPGQDQRLFLFHDRGSTSGETADLKSIQIWYRPRRLTI